MITLRPLVPDDAPALCRVYSGASVRFTSGKSLTADQAEDKIRAILAAAEATPRDLWTWGVVVAGELIGCVGLRPRSATMATISYILREDAWGHGYATKAVANLLAFSCTLPGLESVEAKHHPENPASGRVLTKNGFARIGDTDILSEAGVTCFPTYGLHLYQRGSPSRECSCAWW
ncbi:GNAT family N-acetyltransferase [Streptomyces vilmorinianum]|uniref:GNAT family N-acetyltransferase n=1 Tax=Streptomyces vilmorinianum TaxID=3051092 RepID=UPI0010FB27D9|nr:GNAT family N-acetyltransferase [Streptomyces vilmorinianum]